MALGNDPNEAKLRNAAAGYSSADGRSGFAEPRGFGITDFLDNLANGRLASLDSSSPEQIAMLKTLQENLGIAGQIGATSLDLTTGARQIILSDPDIIKDKLGTLPPEIQRRFMQAYERNLAELSRADDPAANLATPQNAAPITAAATGLSPEQMQAQANNAQNKETDKDNKDGPHSEYDRDPSVVESGISPVDAFGKAANEPYYMSVTQIVGMENVSMDIENAGENEVHSYDDHAFDALHLGAGAAGRRAAYDDSKEDGDDSDYSTSNKRFAQQVALNNMANMTIQQTYDSAMTFLDKKIEGLKKDIETTKAELETARTALAAGQEKAEILRTEIAELEPQVEQAKQDMDQAALEVKDAVADLEQVNKELGQTNSAEIEKNDAVTNAVAEMKEIEESTLKLSDGQAIYTKQENGQTVLVDETGAKLSEQQQQEAEANLADDPNGIRSYEELAAAEQKVNTAMESQFDNIENTDSKLDQKANAEQKLETAKAKYEVFKERYESLSDKLDAKREELTATEGGNAKLEKEIKQMEAKLEKMEADLEKAETLKAEIKQKMENGEIKTPDQINDLITSEYGEEWDTYLEDTYGSEFVNEDPDWSWDNYAWDDTGTTNLLDNGALVDNNADNITFSADRTVSAVPSDLKGTPPETPLMHTFNPAAGAANDPFLVADNVQNLDVTNPELEKDTTAPTAPAPIAPGMV